MRKRVRMRSGKFVENISLFEEMSEVCMLDSENVLTIFSHFASF